MAALATILLEVHGPRAPEVQSLNYDASDAARFAGVVRRQTDPARSPGSPRS
jgi:hypothetical protein